MRGKAAVGAVLLALALVSGCGRSGGSRPAPPPQANEPVFAPQVNEGGGVTAKVVWEGPARGPEFEVRLDTHSVDLSAYDLGELAALQVEGGEELRPLEWKVNPGATTHHLSGTLTFPARLPDGRPALGPGVRSLTLVVRGVAGVPERRFQWRW